MKLDENQLDKSKTMEAQRERKPKVRKPLGDCTNRLSSSRSLIAKKPRNPAVVSAFNKLLSQPNKLAVADPPSETLLADLAPTRPPVSNAERGKSDHKVLEPCSVYTRSAEKTKGSSNVSEESLSDILAAEKRKSKVRNPLGDCTNILPSRSFSSLITRKPRNPSISSAFNKILSDLPAEFAPKKRAVFDQVSAIPPPETLVADVIPTSPSVLTPEHGKSAHKVIEPCSVYTRRRSSEKTKGNLNPSEESLSDILAAEERKRKGKEIAEPSTCPPATKIRKIWDEAKEDSVHNMPKARTAIAKKKRGGRSSAKNELSQDYIEKQRAYFAEIDAFELSEEEVESINDLD